MNHNDWCKFTKSLVMKMVQNCGKVALFPDMVSAFSQYCGQDKGVVVINSLGICRVCRRICGKSDR